ncbi:digestive cysteine proteinase 1-like isoform X1 [Macrosteles quadrilineatus]|uniref:digestive cysteine proteinase 1-like isoform X1 n=1 Tax=Macrosteles quadrilineatus TaxID=74068 RepID=UPI0023E1D3AA|nr:digestive cysteine proteinase 1-like isoform X1 [Macrosteles quadrilineatus]
MKLLLLLALVALDYLGCIAYSEEDEAQWELFKIEYNKTYKNEGYEPTEKYSKKMFMKNLKYIRKHNKKYERGEVTFTVGVNKFADMHWQSVPRMGQGFNPHKDSQRREASFKTNETLEIPDNIDWRMKGAVTEVKDQGECWSSWVFGAVGNVEGQNYLKTKKLVSLSEQNVLDCVYSDDPCGGDQVEKAIRYIHEKGIDTEASYPYEAEHRKVGDCRYNATNIGATISGFQNLYNNPTDLNLLRDVAHHGPMTAVIVTNDIAFQLYKSGVYTNPNCNSYYYNQAVLVVGYGTAKKGGDFWLVKNSWGTSWGMRGYIMMARNHRSMCGIAGQVYIVYS